MAFDGLRPCRGLFRRVDRRVTSLAGVRGGSGWSRSWQVSPGGIFAGASDPVPTPRASVDGPTARDFLGRYHSHTLNMKLTSDPRAAARLRHEEYTYLGLGMLAGSARAYTIHVCGQGVEPLFVSGAVWMKDAELEDGKR